MAIEESGYEVIEILGDIEIRKYHPRIVARTLVSGDFNEVGSRGFKRLAGYIFGNNNSRAKIAMTAPVVQQPVAANIAQSTNRVADEDLSVKSYWVVFVMPAEYEFSGLPQPIDDRVELIQLPAQTLAVLSYRGSWSQDRYQQHETELMHALVGQENWIASGEPAWARYNPPITPWFMRDNEVAVVVTPRTDNRSNRLSE